MITEIIEYTEIIKVPFVYGLDESILLLFCCYEKYHNQKKVSKGRIIFDLRFPGSRVHHGGRNSNLWDYLSIIYRKVRKQTGSGAGL